MKTRILLFIACLFLSGNIFSQTEYYDAIKIKNAEGIDGDGNIRITKDNAAIILPVLAKYAGIVDTLTFGAVNLYYEDVNPFIEIAGSGQSPDLINKVKLSAYAASAVKGIGGLDVTKYAEGMALFMISRAKQELNVAFFQRFKDYLDKYPEVQALFPETYRVTTNLLAYNYTNMINVLRTAYHQDLSRLIYNLEDVFMLPKYRGLNKEFPEILLSIRTISIIASSLEDKESPTDIINKISSIQDWYVQDEKYYLSNIGNGFKLTGLISNSLIHDPYSSYQYNNKTNFLNDSTFQKEESSLITNTITSDFVLKEYEIEVKRFTKVKDTIVKDTIVNGVVVKNTIVTLDTTFNEIIKLLRTDNNIWLTKNEFQAFLLDKNLFNIYLGLIYQTAKVGYEDKIVFKQNNKESIIFTKFLKDKKDTIFIIENLVFSFYNKANLVDVAIDEIKFKKDSAKKITKEDYTRYIYTSVDVLQFGIDIVWKIDPALKDNPYLNMTNTTFDLYKNIYDEKYASAVMNVVTISESIVGLVHRTDSEIKQITKKQKDITKKQIKIAQKQKDIAESQVKLLALNEIDEKQVEITKWQVEITNWQDTITKLQTEINKEKEISIIQKDVAENQAEITSKQAEITSKQKEITNIQTDTTKLKEISEKQKEIRETQNKVSEKQNVIRKTKEIDEEVIKFGKAFQKVSSYGIFMANMVEAKSPDDVKNVIETAAMPVGGSSVKKYAAFNIAVASYLGASFNLCWKKSEIPQRSWDRLLAVSAPIGISASWGLGRSKNGGSISLFGVLLDIGAIVDYRIQGDTAIENEITLGNIFSPGGYVVYGFAWNLPIAIGVGGQYGPGLYKVEKDENHITNSKWIWRAFISVDIPLVTIYNRKKKKK